MKLQTRFSIAVLLLGMVSLSALSYWTINRIPRFYYQAIEESLIDFAALLAEQVSLESVDGKIQTTKLESALSQGLERNIGARIYDVSKQRVNLRVYVTDEKGIVQYDSKGKAEVGKDYSNWRDVILTLRGQYGARATFDDAGESATLYVAAPIYHQDKVIGVLSLGKSTQSVESFVHRAILGTIIVSGLILIGAGLTGVLVAKLVTFPLARLTDYVRKLQAGQQAPAPSFSAPELALLHNAFQELRLELEGRNYIAQFVRTLTHELKGPLAGIRSSVELLDQPLESDQRTRFMSNISTETQRIQSILDKLFELASLQRLYAPERSEPFNMIETVHDAIAALEAQAAARSVSVCFKYSLAEIRVKGDRFLVTHAIQNLLENAIHFSPNTAEVIVSVERSIESAKIVVSNKGEQIPQFALPKIFQSFFSLPRPDTGKKSSGLGLSLVYEIAKLHKGTVTVENVPGGVRSKFEIPTL